MKLFDGKENIIYSVKLIKNINLPANIIKRLEALGIVSGAEIIILNKRRTALIIALKGARFAVGKSIADNINITELY